MQTNQYVMKISKKNYWKELDAVDDKDIKMFITNKNHYTVLSD